MFRPAIMAHRFAGAWEPAAESYLRLLHGGEDASGAIQPYPLFLGYPLDVRLDELGSIQDWQVEWKYDGLRAQVHIIAPAKAAACKSGRAAKNSSRTPFRKSHRPPAICRPNGSGWRDRRVGGQNHPLPFALLQRRINRKQVEATLWTDVPVAFVAFDVLEDNGVDLRETAAERAAAALGADSWCAIASAIFDSRCSGH
jgi:DNA ligase-1